MLQKKIVRYAGLLYAIVLCTDLLALATNIHLLHSMAKPLLMPMLLAMLWWQKKARPEKLWKLVAIGLCFSWLGDIALLFEGNAFFIGGLLSFLTTHVLYFIYFLKFKPEEGENWFRKKPLPSLAVVCYAVFLLSLLMDHLGALKIPVAIYTFVISLMLLQAMASAKRVPALAYRYFVAGAAFFVVSDSMLAYNKFYQPLSWAGIVVMLTYGIAQWLIVTGSINNNRELDLAKDN